MRPVLRVLLAVVGAVAGLWLAQFGSLLLIAALAGKPLEKLDDLGMLSCFALPFGLAIGAWGGWRIADALTKEPPGTAE